MKEIKELYDKVNKKGLFKVRLSKKLRRSTTTISSNLDKNGKFAEKDLQFVKECLKDHLQLEQKIINLIEVHDAELVR